MSIDVTVDLAFGKGVGDTIAEPDWVDVTNDLVVTRGRPSVMASTGRASEREQITPGSCSFALENDSGDYNPLNTTGPYYGDLVAGVPVRITTTYSAVELDRWHGYVTSGWVQTFREHLPVVTVTATDVLGMTTELSRDWPDTISSRIVQRSYNDGRVTDTSKYVGELKAWWRPGVTRWQDSITGRLGSWHGPPELMTTPAGAEVYGRPWRYETDEDGAALIPAWSSPTVPGIYPSATTGKTAILFSFSHDGTVTTPVWEQDNDAGIHLADGPAPPTFLRVEPTWVLLTPEVVRAHLPAGDSTYGDMVVVNANATGVPTQLARDVFTDQLRKGAHTVLFVFDDGDPRDIAGQVYVNGLRFEIANRNGDAPVWPAGTEDWQKLAVVDDENAPEGGRLRASGDFEMATTFLGYPHYPGELYPSSVYTYRDQSLNGYIDHIAVWENITATDLELDEFAAELYLAAQAPETLRLDERVARVMAHAALGRHVGTLDTSSFSTALPVDPKAPLTELQRIEDSEQGRIWVDKDGDLRFSTRGWARDDTVSNTSQLTITNDPTTLDTDADSVEPLDSGSSVIYDPGLLVNRATVTNTEGAQMLVEDDASIVRHGVRNALSLTELLHADDAEAWNIADWLVASSESAPLRVERLAFRVEDDESGLAAFARSVEPGWLVSWDITFADGTKHMDSGHVAGLSHEFTHDSWLLVLSVDSTRTGWSELEWGAEPVSYPGDATGTDVFEWDNSTHGWAF